MPTTSTRHRSLESPAPPEPPARPAPPADPLSRRGRHFRALTLGRVLPPSILIFVLGLLGSVLVLGSDWHPVAKIIVGLALAFPPIIVVGFLVMFLRSRRTRS